MSWRFEYREYVPVAKKIANARKYAREIAAEEGHQVQPVEISGNKIARTFWGEAWCRHLENHSDFDSRLPRGRTYVRNGSVVDLQIEAGMVDAIVAGTEPYDVIIDIAQLKPKQWKQVRDDCASSIDSLFDLLGGRLSDGVMRRLTDPENGLFPSPREIEMECSCPDYAFMCKHIAAVLYAIGARLDVQPELLFLLRGVDHHELASEAVSGDKLDAALGETSSDFAGVDLGDVFGIELDTAKPANASKLKVKKATAIKKTVNKKTAKKKTQNKATQKKSTSTNKKSPTKKTRKKKTSAKPTAAETKKPVARKK